MEVGQERFDAEFHLPSAVKTLGRTRCICGQDFIRPNPVVMFPETLLRNLWDVVALRGDIVSSSDAQYCSFMVAERIQLPWHPVQDQDIHQHLMEKQIMNLGTKHLAYGS